MLLLASRYVSYALALYKYYLYKVPENGTSWALKGDQTRDIRMDDVEMRP